MVRGAMKMETSIAAPIAGRISALKFAQGDKVQSGQVMVELKWGRLRPHVGGRQPWNGTSRGAATVKVAAL